MSSRIWLEPARALRARRVCGCHRRGVLGEPTAFLSARSFDDTQMPEREEVPQAPQAKRGAHGVDDVVMTWPGGAGGAKARAQPEAKHGDVRCSPTPSGSTTACQGWAQPPSFGQNMCSSSKPDERRFSTEN